MKNKLKVIGIVPVENIPPQRRARHSLGGRNVASVFDAVWIQLDTLKPGYAIEVQHSWQIASQFTARISQAHREKRIRTRIKVNVRGNRAYIQKVGTK
jgi:hypothetical protein